MTSAALSSVTMIALLGALIGAGLLLARKRDRIQGLFGPGAKAIRAFADVAPGARIAVVDLDGMTIVCGIGKTGITAIQVVDGVREQVTS